MVTEKKPYKISPLWEGSLKGRKPRYRDVSVYDRSGNSINYYGNIKDSFSLYIRVYSKEEKKPKWFPTGLHYHKSLWDAIESCNLFKEKDPIVKENRARVDAMLQNFEQYNTKPNITLQHFEEALNGKIRSVSTENNFLSYAWKTYMDLPGKIASDSNFNHHKAAIKSIARYINFKYPKIGVENYRVQNINHAFLNGYLDWFESPDNPGKGKSKNTAYSYITDLQIVLNWCTTLNVLSEEHNPFLVSGSEKPFSIPKRTRRAAEYTLNEQQLSLILEATPNSFAEQKAKDLFILCFLMSGLRIGDVIMLRKKDIKESKGSRFFNLTPMKTQRYNKEVQISITGLIQKILDKYPGQGIFVLDCLPADLEWNRKLVNKKAKNYYGNMVNHLKTFTKGIEGLEKEISWSYARFSVNHFMLINDFASRDQIAEMLSHSREVSEGYFNDVGNEKFKIQQRISDTFDERINKKPLGEIARKSNKNKKK